MSNIFFTGLSSGIDWNSMLDKIIEVKSQSLNEIKLKNNIKNYEKNFWSNIYVKLFSLQESINKIRKIGGDVLSNKKAISSNNSIADFEIYSNNIVNNNYILEVKSVATFANIIGAKLLTSNITQNRPANVTSNENINLDNYIINADRTLFEQRDYFQINPEDNGEIIINNKLINWSINDSINDIIARINSSIAGVTANFNIDEQKINIQSNLEGSNAKIEITQKSGNLLNVFKINSGTFYGINGQKTNPEKKLNDINNLDIEVTSGYFTINGVKINVNISEDSINSVIFKINNSGASVFASYDYLNNRIILQQKKSGSQNKIILGAPDDTSNFLYAMKLSNTIPIGGIQDTYAGTDAVISINNGEDIIKSNNEISDVINGIKINIFNKGIASLRISHDEQTIKNAIKEFINSFNNLITEITDKLNEERVNEAKSLDEKLKGVLRSNSSLQFIKNKLLEDITKSYNIENVNFKNLEDIGIKIEYLNNYNDIKLVFDETRFSQKISSNFDDVYKIFTSPNGFAQTIYSTINSLLSFNGQINMEMKEIDLIIKQNNIRINEINQRLASERELLKKQFIQMETIMFKMQNQLNKLLNFQITNK